MSCERRTRTTTKTSEFNKQNDAIKQIQAAELRGRYLEKVKKKDKQKVSETRRSSARIKCREQIFDLIVDCSNGEMKPKKGREQTTKY